MHTDFELKIFRKMLHLFGKLRLASYNYDPETGFAVSKSRDRIRKFIRVLICISYVLNIVMLCIRMQTASTQTKAIIVFNLICLSAEFTVRLSSEIYDSETVHLINNIVQVDKIFGNFMEVFFRIFLNRSKKIITFLGRNMIKNKNNSNFELFRGRLYIVIFGCLLSCIVATTLQTLIFNYKYFTTWTTFGLYTLCTCVGGLFFWSDFTLGAGVFILSAITTNFWAKKCS